MPKSRRMWTDEEDCVIRENYPNGKITEWRYLLPHRNYNVICKRIVQLGLPFRSEQESYEEMLKVRSLVRFWSKVEITGDETCWRWHGSKTNDGYGVFGAIRKPVTAHRFSYELHYGEITGGLQVLHKCDNPECVNPAHLWLGTQKDNIHDAIRKGRFNSTPKKYR